MSIRSFLRLGAHIQLLPVLESGEETLVGGQAVMEGVMMRSPHSYCVAVRKADGEIVTDERPLPRVSEKYPIFSENLFTSSELVPKKENILRSTSAKLCQGVGGGVGGGVDRTRTSCDGQPGHTMWTGRQR